MTLSPEDALDRHLPDPTSTQGPPSLLELVSTGVGIVALLVEMVRRLYPPLHDGVGYLIIHTIFAVAVGLVCIQGIPVMAKEIASKRRSTADYYMLSLLVFCLIGSIYEAQKDLQNHYLGILPILFAGYSISKRKYREYQESLQLASDNLNAGTGPVLEVIEESRKSSSVDLESVKTGDLLKVTAGQRIWVSGIITKGYGLVNQASTQSTPVPRRCSEGESVKPGEILIDGELVIQATENGKPLPKSSREVPDTWLEQFQSLAFNRRQSRLRIIWMSFIGFILIAQFTYSYAHGDWTSGIVPAVSLLIGLNPWGVVLILPLLWRRRFTVTAYKGIQFRNLKLVELFSDQLEIVTEKIGILSEPGIARKKIILSKHFHHKSPFIIRAIRAIEEAAGLSLGAHYFSQDPGAKKVEVKQMLHSDKGAIEAEVFDEEEHRIFIRVGALKSMPYFTHTGFRQLHAQIGENPPRQRLFVTLNDVPAAIMVWDEKTKKSGIELLKQASSHGLPVTIITKDSRSKLETIKGHKLQKVASSKEKMEVVQHIQKNKKQVLYLGYGRNDIPAMATASASMMIENGDPYALPFADAIVTNEGLKLLVGEWLRFKQARFIAQTITVAAIIQVAIVLLLTHHQTLDPWSATLLTGIFGTVMMAQCLKVEK